MGSSNITEAVAAEIKEEIEKYQEQTLPAIIQIPGVSGNTGDRSRRRQKDCGAGGRFRYSDFHRNKKR